MWNIALDFFFKGVLHEKSKTLKRFLVIYPPPPPKKEEEAFMSFHFTVTENMVPNKLLIEFMRDARHMLLAGSKMLLSDK